MYQLKIFSNYAALNKSLKLQWGSQDLSTLIDILTNWPDNVINASSIISSLSYHIIKHVRKLNNIKFNPKTIKYRDYKNYKQTTVSAELSVVNWDIVYNTPDPDMAWDNLKQILSESINQHPPIIKKHVIGKSSPFVFFLTAIWLFHDQLWAMIQDKASLTQC